MTDTARNRFLRDEERATTLNLGQRVKPWGTVAAIHSWQGERFYHFVDKRGAVSVIDSSTAEQAAFRPQTEEAER